MKYEFSFYSEEDYEEILRLVKLAYKWDYPTVGLSRVEFTHGLHPGFTGYKNAWVHTVGVYRENRKIVACVWNEGTYDGEVFFLFDSKERGSDVELLQDMVKFAKTNSSGLKDDRRTRWVNLFIPDWNDTLKEYVLKHGFSSFIKSQWAAKKESIFILALYNKPFAAETDIPKISETCSIFIPYISTREKAIL